MAPVVRTWPELVEGTPTLSGFAGFKAGSIHVITIDDRERTPNFGKPRFNASTIIATPPVLICGLRAYSKSREGLRALGEAYAKNLPKELQRKMVITKPPEENLAKIENRFNDISRLSALVGVFPRKAHLEQKKPFLFEIRVMGGDIKSQLDYLKGLLGKDVSVSDVLKPGGYVDISSITKGKGYEGPVTRFGIKRKHHKSRKSVRAVASIGPWHPAAVTYTVARAGQKGFSQRTEYNKRILLVSNAATSPITPKGGFHKFGIVDGDYIILKGSTPGPVKRLVRIRGPLRPPSAKPQLPKIVSVSVTSTQK